MASRFPVPTGRCIGCCHNFAMGPCGGCGAYDPDDTWDGRIRPIAPVVEPTPASDFAAIVVAAIPDSEKCGHGHILPNPAGAKTQCGGPELCVPCHRERLALDVALWGAAYERIHSDGHWERIPPVQMRVHRGTQGRHDVGVL